MKGQKTGGRQKGTPNKFPSTGKILDELTARGFSIFDEIIALYRDADDNKDRINFMSKIMEFTLPKPAITQNINTGNPENLSPGEIADRMENQIPLLRKLQEQQDPEAPTE